MNRRLLFPTAALLFLAAAGAEELPMSLPEDRELVQSVSPEFYHRGKGTPAEFITSGLGYYNEVIRAIHRLIPERMRRDYFRGAATLDDAREKVRAFRENAIRGFAWKEPRSRPLEQCACSAWRNPPRHPRESNRKRRLDGLLR